MITQKRGNFVKNIVFNLEIDINFKELSMNYSRVPIIRAKVDPVNKKSG